MSSKKKKSKGDSSSDKIHCFASKNLTWTLYDLKWLPSSSRFVALGSHPRGTGGLSVFDTTENGIEETSLTKEYRDPFKCGTFGSYPISGGRLFVTGDFEGRISSWNLENLGIPLWTSKAHDSIIHCIDGIGGNSEGPQEIVTGGKDGTVKLFDLRSKNHIGNIAPLSNSSKTPQVWSVSFSNSFNNSERNLSIGYESGDLKIFDLRMNRMKFETKMEQGICNISFNDQKIQNDCMVVTCLSGFIYLFDLKNQNSENGFDFVKRTDTSTTIWFSRFQPSNQNIFLTGSGQGSVYLYNYKFPKERNEKKEKTQINLLGSQSISKQPILCFDWNSNFPNLCCIGALDSTLRVGLLSNEILK